jgi:hypothetical protein
MLNALNRELQFELNPALAANQREFAYEALAVRFDFFGSGMTLTGICNRQRGLERLPTGIVFVGGGAPLLASGPSQQTWVNLARTMWPDGTQALPISTPAWLFNVLPTPSPIHALTTGEGDLEENLPPRITSANDFQGTPTITQPY